MARRRGSPLTDGRREAADGASGIVTQPVDQFPHLIRCGHPLPFPSHTYTNCFQAFPRSLTLIDHHVLFRLPPSTSLFGHGITALVLDTSAPEMPPPRRRFSRS